ncbi:MAG: Uma2 family endonuclease [Isosphaeraceae bacterium]
MNATTSTVSRRQTLTDLARTEGKAELIGGRIVHLMATGHKPNRVAFRIARSLDDHSELTGRGVAYTDSMGFAIPELPSGRESFSPDASFHVGDLPDNLMQFVEGPPTFAVEVRSENDYTATAEAAMAAKRADYFLAGTLVAWDVDPVVERVSKYRSDSPDQPVVFARGQVADAEPAVPGWRIPVDRVFASGTG